MLGSKKYPNLSGYMGDDKIRRPVDSGNRCFVDRWRILIQVARKSEEPILLFSPHYTISGWWFGT